jgi:hypothetical protein
MRLQGSIVCIRTSLLCIAALLFIKSNSLAQQLKITEFVLFGGGVNCVSPPGTSSSCGIFISSSSKVQSGAVGSYSLITTTGNATFAGSLHSNGRIQLANGNSVVGRITARNAQGVGGTILSVGSNALLSGNIDVNGNIVVASGRVLGTVTHPTNTTYTGPEPADDITAAELIKGLATAGVNG